MIDGKVNLGSNTRKIFDDGRHGINNADWGLGSVKGYSQLPIDNFLVKAYTEVNLEGGQTYEFEARGDDKYQMWLKNLDTEEWSWVTEKGQWQSKVGMKEEATIKYLHTIAIYDKLEYDTFVGRISSGKGVMAFVSKLSQGEN